MVNCLTHKNKEIYGLIEKRTRDSSKNWKPISLENVDVKIGAKATAKQLEAVLPDLIHHNQNACVKVE